MKTDHIVIILALSLILSACSPVQQREQQSLEEVSKQELATALEERDQLLALVKEVSAGLKQIKHLENMMTMAAAHPDGTPAARAQILADIASVKKKIQQRKAQLQELESKLHNSTINNKELTETIEALRLQIDSQIEVTESLRMQLMAANEQIGELNNTVDSLNSTVTAVTGERNAAMEASERFENELNTCFYVVATKSDLKDHNIIESGFLRKTKLMKGDFDQHVFKVADKRRLRTVHVPGRKADLLTNHPPRSYRLTAEGDSIRMHIIDPERFWALTNYMVIQTD